MHFLALRKKLVSYFTSIKRGVTIVFKIWKYVTSDDNNIKDLLQSLLLINRLLTFPVPDNQFLVISTVTFRFRFRFRTFFFVKFCARLAQSERSLTANQKVPGSIPGLVGDWTLGGLPSPHRPWTGTLKHWSSLSTFYRGTKKNPHTCR